MGNTVNRYYFKHTGDQPYTRFFVHGADVSNDDSESPTKLSSKLLEESRTANDFDVSKREEYYEKLITKVII